MALPLKCGCLQTFVMMKAIKRINAWSSPRNVSTAFMYAFAQRQDTVVVDEPLYAHYLSKTDSEAAHPGRDQILASQSRDGQRVVREVLFGPYHRPVVLFKQMAHHLIHLDESFLSNMDNILLIRDPRAIIASYSQVISNPVMADVGIEKLYGLFHQLREQGRLAAVIDAKELLLNPASVLNQLCHCLGLPFDERMLHWLPGPRPEDGVWAPYWYATVHRSTGFQPYQPRHYELPENLKTLAEQCRPYYEELYEASLKA